MGLHTIYVKMLKIKGFSFLKRNYQKHSIVLDLGVQKNPQNLVILKLTFNIYNQIKIIISEIIIFLYYIVGYKSYNNIQCRRHTQSIHLNFQLFQVFLMQLGKSLQLFNSQLFNLKLSTNLAINNCNRIYTVIKLLKLILEKIAKSKPLLVNKDLFYIKLVKVKAIQ